MLVLGYFFKENLPRFAFSNYPAITFGRYPEITHLISNDEIALEIRGVLTTEKPQSIWGWLGLSSDLDVDENLQVGTQLQIFEPNKSFPGLLYFGVLFMFVGVALMFFRKMRTEHKKGKNPEKKIDFVTKIQLSGCEKEITMGAKQEEVLKDEINVSAEQKEVSNEEVTMSAVEKESSNEEVTMTAVEKESSNEEVTMGAEEKEVSKEEITISTEENEATKKEVVSSNELNGGKGEEVLLTRHSYGRDLLMEICPSRDCIIRPLFTNVIHDIVNHEVNKIIPTEGYSLNKPKWTMALFEENSSRPPNMFRNNERARRSPYAKGHTVKIIEISRPKLKETQNRWEPKTKGTDGFDETLKQLTKSTLNKMTLTNYERLLPSVIDNLKKTAKESHINHMAEILFQKAIEDGTYGGMYAELLECISRVPEKGPTFVKMILRELKRIFDEPQQLVDKEKRQNENDVDFLERKVQRTMKNCVVFAAEMYNKNVIHINVALKMAENLLWDQKIDKVKWAGDFFLTCGEKLFKASRNTVNQMRVDTCFDQIEAVKESHKEKKVKFLLMDLIELKESGWQKKAVWWKKNTEAQTLSEIKKAVEMETGKSIDLSINRKDEEKVKPRDNYDKLKADLDFDSAKAPTEKILKKLSSDCFNCDETIQEIQSTFYASNMNFFIYHAMNWAIDQLDKTQRCRVGQIFEQLAQKEVLKSSVIIESLEEILMMAEDLKSDVPKVSTYIGEILGQCLTKKGMGILSLWAAATYTGNMKTEVFLAILLKAADSFGAEHVAEMWKRSAMNFKMVGTSYGTIDEFLRSAK